MSSKMLNIKRNGSESCRLEKVLLILQCIGQGVVLSGQDCKRSFCVELDFGNSIGQLLCHAISMVVIDKGILPNPQLHHPFSPRTFNQIACISIC